MHCNGQWTTCIKKVTSLIPPPPPPPPHLKPTPEFLYCFVRPSMVELSDECYTLFDNFRYLRMNTSILVGSSRMLHR